MLPPKATLFSALLIELIPSATPPFPLASALTPNACEKSPVAVAEVPKAVLNCPVAFAPAPTAVAELPEALASQAASPSRAVLATLPELHPAKAELAPTLNATNTQLRNSAARLADKTLIFDGISLGVGRADWVARDNTNPFAPACAALLRNDFMFNPRPTRDGRSATDLLLA
ncbi:MAG: hypothetical protein WDO17_12330 [Alphaproteobacteria bacterium]